jgi:hypothetical protein
MNHNLRGKLMCARSHTAADLPPGFARLPEPLRGVRQNQHNFLFFRSAGSKVFIPHLDFEKQP